MPRRNRRTWAGDKVASPPPAVPGYLEYFTDEGGPHPAATEDPAYDAYKKGDPSAWAEDPHPGPYRESPAPQLPGYHQEDGKAHPADDRDGRNVRANRDPKAVRRQLEKRAAKCIRIAQHMLGKKASVEELEDQALDLMDMPPDQIEATLGRIGGGFLSTEEEMVVEETACGPEMAMMHGMDDEVPMPMEEVVEEEMVEEEPDLMGMVMGMREELDAMKMADQNAPTDTYQGDEGVGGEFSEAEIDSTTKEVVDEVMGMSHYARKVASDMFNSMDTDRDGFVTTEDWTGDKELFATLDTDGDGILAHDEVVDLLASKFSMDEDQDEEADEDDDKEGGKKADADEGIYAGLDDEEKGMLREMLAEDETSKSDEKVAGEDEVVEKEQDEAAAKEEEDNSKKADDAEVDEAGTFAMQSDPMGLNEEITLGDGDEALIDLFGKNAADDDDEEEAEEAEEEAEDAEEEAEEAEEEAEDAKEGGKKKKAMSKAASRRPQLRKPSKGVKRVGTVPPPEASGEIDELSNLWDRKPDVSDAFSS